MGVSWRKSPRNYAEPVIGLIRDLVAAHRESGVKTFAAFDDLAPELDLPPRRVRRLFEREGNPWIGIDEYTRLLLRGARVLRGVADKLRERADRWDSEADLLELKHRQLTLWGNGEGEWGASNCGEKPHRRAA